MVNYLIVITGIAKDGLLIFNLLIRYKADVPKPWQQKLLESAFLNHSEKNEMEEHYPTSMSGNLETNAQNGRYGFQDNGFLW